MLVLESSCPEPSRWGDMILIISILVWRDLAAPLGYWVIAGLGLEVGGSGRWSDAAGGFGRFLRVNWS